MNGAKKLPQNLLDALRLFQNSKVVPEVLGASFVDSYAKLKHQEWQEYTRHSAIGNATTRWIAEDPRRAIARPKSKVRRKCNGAERAPVPLCNVVSRLGRRTFVLNVSDTTAALCGLGA